MPEDPKETGPTKDNSLKALAAEKAGALTPQDSVGTAGERMRERDTGKWPVAEDGKIVGMIDEANPDWQAGGRGHDPGTASVGEIMSRELIFCYEDDDCASAQRVMQERGLRYLPVVDRQMQIVGIFSRDEIEQRAAAAGSEAIQRESPATS